MGKKKDGKLKSMRGEIGDMRKSEKKRCKVCKWMRLTGD